MTVTIRPAVDEDCALMPAFRREMEGGAFLADLRNEDYYRYKYLEFGRAFVAREGPRLVGVTAATPRRVRIHDGVHATAEMGDLFVHPDHRGRGLFRELHDAVLQSVRMDGATLVTVRAGRGAVSHMRKAFGYRRLFRIAEMVAALTPAGLSGLPFGRTPVLRSLLPRARPESRLRVVPDRTGGTRHTAGGRRGGDGWARAEVVRDRDRIRSRYDRDPCPYEGVAVDGGGEARAGAVLLVSGGKGFIVDAWGPGEDPLAAAAIRRLAERGADVVHFWCTKGGDRFAAALSRRGLRIVRRRKSVLVRILDDGLGDLPRSRDWCFRMGDTDGI